MDTPLSTPETSTPAPAFSERLRHSKALIPTLAVMAVTVMALATTLVVSRTQAQPGAAEMSAQAVQPAPAISDKASAARLVSAAPATHATHSAPVTHLALAASAQHVQHRRVTPHEPQVQAQACAGCGTVESVVAVQRQGQVNGVAVGNTTVGLGTVAGGLIGGLLGNQTGGGSGKTAMTVLGVAGGAYAGNAIEKNMKKVTVYQMRVRMRDGSVRTIEQPSAVQPGTQVIVEGGSLRLA